ncbi:protein kinase domain-containing protein [Rosistilla oblonga]|uniref:protein kinase domain-containing protein n=1 Tax=Rosistilla oblonga TaxID=2527990 RepID=UPI003A977B9A
MTPGIQIVCRQFIEASRDKRHVSIESLLAQLPLQDRAAGLRELIQLEVEQRQERGENPEPEEYVQRFPDSVGSIKSLFFDLDATCDQVDATTDPIDATCDQIDATTDPIDATCDQIDATTDRIGATTDLSNSNPNRFQRIGPNIQTTGSPDSLSASRFRVVRSHAKGGLGEVFLAHDSELNRDVALKEIQLKHAHSAEGQSRFVLEAEVTGRLEHPGIVPVYSLGRYPDGRPFYAMKFVRGASFRDALVAFHEKHPNKTASLFYGRELQQLMRRFIDVCNAIDYAHERGVLHRDIKPANVMVGDFGETLVVDWGLAKILDDETPDMTESQQERKISPAAGSIVATTVGSVVGTPAFMSPEQANGNEGKLTRGSDIYSLGATLFTILTKEYAVSGGFSEIFEQLQTGSIRTVRDVIPVAPAALDAICSKAMARHSKDRYATARAMADDIERWLADEPVEAYRDREKYVERAGRLIRRYRSWTLSIAGALLAIVMVSLLASLLINQARLREHAAQVQATQFKGEALDRYQMSRAAIDQWLVGSSDALAELPATQSVRKRLLQQAADDLTKLSETRSADPELELERARALVRLGDVYQMQEDYPQARQQYDEALSAFESEVLINASELKYRRQAELANTHSRIGLSWDFADDAKNAEKEYRNAIDGLRNLNRDWSSMTQSRPATTGSASEATPEINPPGDVGTDALKFLSAALNNLADLHRRTGDLDSALPLLEESIVSSQAAFAQSQDNAHRIAAATSRETLGRTLLQLGNPEPALHALDACIEDLADILAEQPDSTAALIANANANVSRSAVLRQMGDWDQEIQSLQQAADIYQTLRSQQPDVPRYAESLAITQTDAGLTLLNLGNVAGADQLLEAAKDQYGDLIAYYPNVPRYQEGWAAALDGYAQTQMELSDDRAKAFEALQLAGNAYTKLIQDAPEQVQYFERLAIVTSHFAECLSRQGDQESAAARFAEATDLLNQLIAANPNMPSFRNSQAHVKFRHALLVLADDPEQGTTLLESAQDTWNLLSEEVPSSSEFRYELVKFLLRSPVSSLRDRKRGQQLAKSLAERSANNLVYASLLAESLAFEEPATALKHLERIETIRGELTAEDLCAAAVAKHTLGEATGASQSLQMARDWIAENRPHSIDLQRLVEETAEIIAPLPEANK